MISKLLTVECQIDELKQFSIEMIEDFFKELQYHLVDVYKTTYIDRYVRFDLIFLVTDQALKTNYYLELLCELISDTNNPIYDVRNDPDTQNMRIENFEWLYHRDVL